jgi:hypothetical protein
MEVDENNTETIDAFFIEQRQRTASLTQSSSPARTLNARASTVLTTTNPRPASAKSPPQSPRQRTTSNAAVRNTPPSLESNESTTSTTTTNTTVVPRLKMPEQEITIITQEQLKVIKESPDVSVPLDDVGDDGTSDQELYEQLCEKEADQVKALQAKFQLISNTIRMKSPYGSRKPSVSVIEMFNDNTNSSNNGSRCASDFVLTETTATPNRTPPSELYMKSPVTQKDLTTVRRQIGDITVRLTSISTSLSEMNNSIYALTQVREQEKTTGACAACTII